VRSRLLMPLLLLLAAIPVIAAACGGGDDNASAGPAGGGTISGAGATFPQPVYDEWASRFKDKTGTTVNYNAIGSGGGIAQFTANTVDFGATDSAMKDEEVKAAEKKGTPVHVPTVFGAITIAYNVPGVDKGLKLDGGTAADIFLGKIKKWNDPAIKQLNPSLDLPDTGITVVHRSDESGTTKLFTTFVSDYSPEWSSKVGADKTVKWPTGTGAKGNAGVAGGVKQTDGAVGYVELEYATVSGLSSAFIKNAAGKYVPGSVDGVTAAAEAIADKFPADFRQAPIINGAGDTTYPIAAYTYILAYVDQKDADKGKSLVAFLYWALTDGQGEEKAIGYAPLPQSVQQKALAELHQLSNGGAPIWP
jgi:phosphate transport system substrate-binding protein